MEKEPLQLIIEIPEVPLRGLDKTQKRSEEIQEDQDLKNGTNHSFEAR